MGTRHLSEQITEQQVGLAVALVVGVITLLVGVDARTLPEVLGPITDEDGVVEACREDACASGARRRVAGEIDVQCSVCQQSPGKHMLYATKCTPARTRLSRWCSRSSGVPHDILDVSSECWMSCERSQTKSARTEVVFHAKVADDAVRRKD